MLPTRDQITDAIHVLEEVAEWFRAQTARRHNKAEVVLVARDLLHDYLDETRETQ